MFHCYIITQLILVVQLSKICDKQGDQTCTPLFMCWNSLEIKEMHVPEQPLKLASTPTMKSCAVLATGYTMILVIKHCTSWNSSDSREMHRNGLTGSSVVKKKKCDLGYVSDHKDSKGAMGPIDLPRRGRVKMSQAWQWLKNLVTVDISNI